MIFERILGIAACDPRGVMGKNGGLPWHCPEELKHFSETTLHMPVIVGHRTFLSLSARYLESRTTIVFSHKKPISPQSSNRLFVSSLAEFFALDRTFKDLYVIGGAQIYTLFLKENLIDEFILTKMKAAYEGDTFFPLALLASWSSTRIRETDAFAIERYNTNSRLYGR